MRYKYAEKPEKCPACGSSKVADVIYGYLDYSDELQSQLDQGKIILGGCCVTNDDPEWQCSECGVDIYRFKLIYDRTLTEDFSRLLEPGGDLRWLFEYVKIKEDLDFQIGKHKKRQWISIYRGLSRILKITKSGKDLKLEAAKAYKEIFPELYGIRSVNSNFQKQLDYVSDQVEKRRKFDRYYNNHKEGFYQNKFSRRFGICGKPDDSFVIIDKEAVIGYEDNNDKKAILEEFKLKYRKLYSELLKIHGRNFGQNLEEKTIGNELDFVALDRGGRILIVEYKHGSNTAGIYLSPIQIAAYFELFSRIHMEELSKSIYKMLEQKQRIGLINQNWSKPVIREMYPVIVISEYNEGSVAKENYEKIKKTCKTILGKEVFNLIKVFIHQDDDTLMEW